MFLCDKDPQTLLNESVANLELLAQKIHEIENNIKRNYYRSQRTRYFQTK